MIGMRGSEMQRDEKIMRRGRVVLNQYRRETAYPRYGFL